MFRKGLFILFVVLSAFILVMWAWSHISPLSFVECDPPIRHFSSLLLANGDVVFRRDIDKKVLLTEDDIKSSRFFAPNGDPLAEAAPDSVRVSFPGFYFCRRLRTLDYLDEVCRGPKPYSIIVVDTIAGHLRFSAFFVVVAGPVLVSVLLRHGLRPWLRTRRNQCLKCGYDLRGLPEPRCPECGRTIPRRQFESAGSESFQDKRD